MSNETCIIADPVEMLDTLREFSFIRDYSLAVFSASELIAKRGDRTRMCGLFGESWLCVDSCRKTYIDETTRATEHCRSRIFRCATGLLIFVIPFKDLQQNDCLLLGGGVREKFVDLEHLENFIRKHRLNGIHFLEQWERLPCVTRLDVQKVIDNIYNIMPLLGRDNYYARAYERTIDLINTVSDLGPEIDRASSVDQVLELLSETLTILFNVPRIAILYPQGKKRQLVLKGILGLDNGAIRLGPRRSSELLQHRHHRILVLRGEKLKKLFPYLETDHLTCLPLVVDARLIGFLALFDTELATRDLMIIELLAGRVADKLVRLRRRQNREEESNRSKKLVGMISRLAQLENSQHFYQGVVEMAAELCGAGKGSLMLFDDSQEKLVITASLGLNKQLARNLKLQRGQGIAGQVAATGSPILVHDINQDKRFIQDKRPRFETHSFISLPFRCEGKIVGVLNLSDKHDRSAFTVADLKVLEQFLEHAGSLIKRADTLERATLLEKLSWNDALTGLHNRRFLDQRLEEELNRGSRQKQEFSVLMLDLDHFKLYNDRCGHIAGDKALKKLGQLLRRSAREMDTVARYGGEEFCVLLPETGPEPARQAAERIRHSIEREPFYQEDYLPGGRLTVSIGLASYPRDGDSAEALLDAADRALYKAKEKGRNQVQVFDAAIGREKIVFI